MPRHRPRPARARSKTQRVRRAEAKRAAVLTDAERWRTYADVPCDACGAPRSYHLPLCGEEDPMLISFWVSVCESCLLDQERAAVAYRAVRTRGWARGGVVVAEHAALAIEERDAARS